MPHVSKNKLLKKQEDELIHNLNVIISSVDDYDQTALFLNALLSDTEKLMLAKRIAIIVMIEEELSDSDIAKGLHLTRITVEKMRYFYEARGEGFKVALKKLDEKQQLDSFKRFLVSLGKYSIRAAGGYVKP